MLRCASSLVIAAFSGTRSDPFGLPEHVPDASFLWIRAHCLRPFYEAAPISRLLRLYSGVVMHDLCDQTAFPEGFGHDPDDPVGGCPIAANGDGDVVVGESDRESGFFIGSPFDKNRKRRTDELLGEHLPFHRPGRS